MNLSTASGVTAQARAIMDRALAADKGIVLTFKDADNGGPQGAYSMARRWATRLYTARSHMRKIQMRTVNPAALLETGITSVASDPEAIRTAYDNLYTNAVRSAADDAWELHIINASADTGGLDIREL